MSTTPIEYYGLGKRKTSVARVHLRPGTGEISLNHKPLEDYFGGHEALKILVRQPFAVTETTGKSTLGNRSTPSRKYATTPSTTGTATSTQVNTGRRMQM